MKQSPGTDSRLLETLRAKLSGSGDTCIPSRDDLADLLAAHEKLIRRFDRVVKISDGYQYQLQETTKALQDALTNVKMLSGLLPICASCKKVRSVDGYWKQIEQYLTENSEADISHGLCPECAANYMHLLEDPARTPDIGRISEHLSREDLNNPVVAHYLTLINNRHFADSPLYDDLIRLLVKYIQLERRIRRIARISDNYQAELQTIKKTFEQESKHDYLTGLPNRRRMYQSLEAEISRMGRHGGTLALILFDFDQFKTVNDTYGHEAGDLILQRGARLIQDELRMEDRCARWGGDEFLIIQPGGTPEGIAQCSERLRKAIAKAPMLYSSTEISVTISLGVAIYRKGEQLEECINRADKSLYAAKEAGRNQTGPLAA